jgi:hypothetical protein
MHEQALLTIPKHMVTDADVSVSSYFPIFIILFPLSIWILCLCTVLLQTVLQNSKII